MNKIWILVLLINIVPNIFKLIFNKTRPNSEAASKCSILKGILRNLAKFTRKHLCQSLLFNKVADLGSTTLLKKRLWHRYFPVNFVKFLRRPFSQNTSERLVLWIYSYSLVFLSTLSLFSYQYNYFVGLRFLEIQTNEEIHKMAHKKQPN